MLEYLAERAADCRSARIAGVQSEMELAFAGLHQLCAPLLDHDEALSLPQREALRITFGLHTGPTPDRFLVALADGSRLHGTSNPGLVKKRPIRRRRRLLRR